MIRQRRGKCRLFGKELQADETDNNQHEGTQATKMCALTEKDNPNNCCPQGPNSDEARVNRRSGQALYRFTQQKKNRKSEDHRRQSCCPFRKPDRALQNEGPCALEYVRQKYVYQRHQMPL